MSSDEGPEKPVLEANSTDGNNNLVPSNSPIAQGGCDQCIDKKYLIILAVALGVTVIASIIAFVLYRKRAKRKEREAGNVSIDISRGPKRN